MVTVIKKPATVADLYKVADGGKAELVKGELRLMAPTGLRPGFASSKIWLSLYQYVQAGHAGVAVGDNVGFIVDLPNRQSFSPRRGILHWCGFGNEVRARRAGLCRGDQERE